MNEFGRMAIIAVVCLGIVGLLYLGATAVGISIPWWVPHAIWIIIAVFVVVMAIKLLLKIGNTNP